MAEYIMREYAVDAVLDVYYDTPDIDLSGEKFEDAILKIPAVDAVVVTRCKNCAHKERATVNEKGFLICPASGMEITPDDFCSYGEPKEGTC